MLFRSGEALLLRAGHDSTDRFEAWLGDGESGPIARHRTASREDMQILARAGIGAAVTRRASVHYAQMVHRSTRAERHRRPMTDFTPC